MNFRNGRIPMVVRSQFSIGTFCGPVTRLRPRSRLWKLNWSRWQPRKRCRSELPEWQDPNGSAIPIQYRDILRAGNKTETEVAAVEAELESLAATEAMPI